MPKIYRNIEQKRFNELDEADRNIWSRVVKDEGKAVEQFDSPIKFQSKFERITAYTLQKLLEDLRNEFYAVIDEYNKGKTEDGDEAGDYPKIWNTAVSYLKNIIMSGSISNKDIEKINSMLDSLKPLVSQVLSIAEEYRFSDLPRLRQLKEKFDGNDWTPITIVSKVQNVNDLVQDLPEAFVAKDDKDDDDEDEDEKKNKDVINPKKDNLDEILRKLNKAKDELKIVIDNLPDYGLEQLRELYRHYVKGHTRNISKSKLYLELSEKLEDMYNRVVNILNEIRARDENFDDEVVIPVLQRGVEVEEPEDVFYDVENDDMPDEKEYAEGEDVEINRERERGADWWGVPEQIDDADDDFGFGGLYGMGAKLKKKQQKMKKMKVKKSTQPLQYNDLLNDAYLFQGNY